MRRNHQEIFDQMKEKWPSGIVSRSEIGKFTGGILSPGTMANVDSMGLGPERMTIGRKVAYPVDSLVQWLIGRTQ